MPFSPESPGPSPPLVAFLFGITEFMMALLDRPEAVRKALERRHEVALQQAREICAAGARFIWIGEGLGSGSLISPEQYREFALPYEQSLAEEIRKAGGLSRNEGKIFYYLVLCWTS